MTMLETLARRGNRAALFIMDWNPDQPRDENGRWGEGGSASTSAEHSAAEAGHTSAAEVAFKSGNKVLYHAHESAVRAHREAAQSGSPEASHRARQATKGALEADREARNDPRTTSSHEQDKMEARQLASGERVPLKQGPTQAGGYRGNPAAEGSRAVREDDRVRNKDLRTTQTEMPAVKEAPVALMAPHSQLPVGNTKPKEPIFADLRRTQELPVVNTPMVVSGRVGTTKESRRDAAAASAGRWASRALEQKAKGQTQEDRQRISANLRAKGDPAKAANFMQKSEQATALSKGNALSALAAQHSARGNHAEAAKTYEEARAHFVRAGKENVAAKMAWSRIESEGKAKKR